MQPEQQQRIMGYFIEEAKDHLGTIEQGLLNLQGTMEDPEMVNEVFRAAHSVKGGAAMLGLDSIQRTAHRLEDSFKILKDSPIVIDDKLETLFLRVKDILQDLLENLQGPLGLTEEIAGNIMSGVDPIFEELNNHLEFLVHGKEATSTGTAKKTKIKVPVSLNKKAIQQTFQKDVVVRLREMLQQFKQPDSPGRRQQLQADCEYLANLGTQYNLTTWGDLLEIGKVAIATPTNPYRQLASVIIKEIKQAQELVLAGQVDEIVPSDALKALAPDWSLLLGHPPSTYLEAPQTELRETIPQLTVVPQLDAYQPQTAAFPTSTRKMDARETKTSSDPNGPEVGTAELNSLADLFEGEAPDLDQTWQEEEILTTAVNTGGSPSTPASDLFDRSDFSDLLGDMNATTTPSNDEDLMGLFGDDAPTLSPIDTHSTTGTDDFSDLLFEAESSTPETSVELTDLFGDDFFEEDSSEDVLVGPSNNGAVSEDEWLDSLDNESLSSLADLETTSDTLRDDSLNDFFSLEEEAPTSSASDSFSELNDLQSLFPNETVIQAEDDWMGFDTQEYVIEDEEISANLNDDVLDVQSSQSDWEDLFGEEGLEAPEANLSLANSDDMDINARQDTLFFEESEAAPSDDLLSFDLGEVPEATTDLDLFSLESSEAIAPTSSNLLSDFDTSISELEDFDDFNEALFDTDESTETETNLNNAENLQALFGTEESVNLSGSSLGDRTETFEWDLTPTSSNAEELDLTSEVNAEAFDWDLTPTSSNAEELEELNLTPEVNAEAFDWETPSPETSELEEFDITPEVNAEAFEWDLTPTSSNAEELEELNLTPEVTGEAFDWETASPETSELEEFDITPEVNAEAFDWETPSPETSELEEFDITPEVNAEAFEWDLTPTSSNAEELEELNLTPEVNAEAFDWETPSPETSELEELNLTPEVNAEAFDWETPSPETSELEELNLTPEVNAEAFEWDLTPTSSNAEGLEEFELTPEVTGEAFDWETASPETSELEEFDITPEVNAEAFEWDLTPTSSNAEGLEEFELTPEVTGEAFDWETASPETSELEELNLTPEINAEAFEWDLTPTSSNAEELEEFELTPEVNAEAFEWDLTPTSSNAEELEEVELTPEVTGEAFDWETASPETSELEEFDITPEVNAEAFEWDLGEIEEPTSDRLLDLAAEELSPEAAVNLENLLEEHQSDRSLLAQELSSDDPLLDFALEEGVLAGTDDDLDNFFLSDSSTQTELSEVPDLELDALLDEPADEPELIAVDELDSLQDREDFAFDTLGEMDFGDLLDEPTTSSEMDFGNLLDEPTNSEFDDLDSLLQPMSVSNEFDDLDAMLGDMEDLTPVGASNHQEEGSLSIPDDLSSTDLIDDDLDNEFGDLEKLLEQADQTMGGQPTVKSAPGSNRPTARPRQTRVFEQTMRVPVKQLDNLNNLMGELVVNRNTLEQDQERLRQFLDNLLNQVQQLSDVGSRMQDLYERSLLESSLLASRQGYQSPLPGGFSASSDTHSSGAKFDVLEMDRFTGFHLLSQEMIELIVRVRESASDITFLVDETDQVARMLRQVTTQLQEGLTRSRMVPFAQTADRLPRAVREISVKLRKSAELYIEGRETLIDKMILEHLYDPMTHLVNNAITHGIETPEERLAAGKPPTGRITIRTFHQGNQTIISVSDDGAGINPERVKAKAIEKGLLDAEDARKLSRIEVYDLLFHAGFSTKDQADDYSGRGVGMDVVRTSISEIRGAVAIDSTLGKGTTFTIRLPLTLSICKALCCLSDRTRIAFPMDGVEEMNDIPNSRIQTNDEGQTCFQWRDTLMPFQPLNELLTYNRQLSRGNIYGGKRDDDAISIIVLRSAGNFIAVQVDQVLGEREIVIKQLEGPVPKPVGVAGATVLGDGHIMPIADVLELIDISTGRIRKDNGGDLWKSSTPNLPQEAIPVKTEPMVLIVDDSITVRELLSMTFNKSGYRVEQARDGQEAWEKLRSGLPCDLVFCDIEMPRMDGLELLSRLQKDENLCNLPIAMLTSRGADRHRQLASQLGASGYFTKPYLEEMLLDAAQRMIKGEDLLNGGSHS